MEDELGVALGAEPDDREAGRLGLRADDGEVLPDEAVEQGGFPDVGDAGEGDVAGFRHGGNVAPFVSGAGRQGGRAAVRRETHNARTRRSPGAVMGADVIGVDRRTPARAGARAIRASRRGECRRRSVAETTSAERSSSARRGGGQQVALGVDGEHRRLRAARSRPGEGRRSRAPGLRARGADGA